jgi:CheY-like chemotaxis protein
MQLPISRQELFDVLVDLSLSPLTPGATLTVLIVDDDAKSVELTAVKMKDMATTVLRAYGGREAIEVARTRGPDLIVLDLMMPEVSGFDVVKALHEDPKTAGIPIIVLTAKSITQSDRATLNGFVAAIMEKSDFDRDGFTAEVRRALAHRAAEV